MQEEVITINVEGLTTIDLQIKKLDEILSRYPDDVSVTIAIAEFNLRRGRHLEALQAYQKIVSLKDVVPRDVDVIAHLGLARIFMLQNMIMEAYKELLYVFEISPRNVEGRVLYTWLSHIKEPPSDAKEAYISYEKEEQLEIEDLKVFRHQKELEIIMLEHEISQLEKMMDENDGEPIHEYNYEMAIMRKKHVEEMIKYIDILESHIAKQVDEAKVKAEPILPEEVVEPTAGEFLATRDGETRETPLEIEETPAGEIMGEEPPALEMPGAEPLEADAPTSAVPGVEPSEAGPTVSEIAVEEPPEEVIIEQPKEVKEIGFEVEEAIVQEGGDTSIIGTAEILEEDIHAEIVDEKTYLQEVEDLLGTEEPTISLAEPEAAEKEVSEEKPAVSQERMSFYESIKENVTTVLANLIKTKGVTVVMTVAKDGIIIDSIINEAIAHEGIAVFVKAGIEVIRSFRQDETGKAFLYWVLEFEQGLLVLRSIDGEHFLLALAKAGANFGAMRYSMEKEKERLVEILSAAPIELFEPA